MNFLLTNYVYEFIWVVYHPYKFIKMNTKNDTRKRLLQAAVQEFSRSGYAKTNINEVSLKAGFGKGTIYNYFDNKFDLFITVIREIMEEISLILHASIEGIDDPLEMLRQAILADFRYFEENRDLIILILRESYSSEREHHGEFIAATAPLFNFYRQLIELGVREGCFRQDINPLLACLQFLGMSENLILMQYAIGDEIGTSEELAMSVMETFINGIVQRKPEA